MSARKFESTSAFRPVTVQSRQTRLTLNPEDVCIRKSGVEFRSDTAITPWTEMTIVLQSSRDSGKVQCNGVVVGCVGDRHTGFFVSMIFTSLSKQAQARLNMIAFA